MHYKFGLCMTGAGLWVLSREKFHKRMFLEISDKSSPTMTWSAKRSLLGRGSFLAYVTLVYLYLRVRVFRTLFYFFIKACFFICSLGWEDFPPSPKNKNPSIWNSSASQHFNSAVFFFSESGQPEKPPPQKKTTRRFLTTHLGLASCRYSICIWLFASVLYIIYILHTNTTNIDI